MADSCDVAIVGGGPVGLYLALSLIARGLAVVVLEREYERRPGSRAIGIHPPGLACLERVGVASALVEQGVRVECGLAFGERRGLGMVSFAGLASPFPFVLAVPQAQMEHTLEEALRERAPHALVRGAQVRAVIQSPQWVKLEYQEGPRARTLEARYAVACDGKRSTLRECAGIAFAGGPYPDPYMMGDFRDDTSFGARAAVFLTRRGLVESFPLPGGTRRWVARLADAAPADVDSLAETVRARTGFTLRTSTCSMLSAFTAEHFLAERFTQGRVLLAGDAAHVVSPIGGQGLTLGWLDGSHLAALLPHCMASGAPPPGLEHYGRVRRRAARSAMRRAELFMRLGRPSPWSRLRDRVVQGVLSPPLGALSARLFTMASEHPSP